MVAGHVDMVFTATPVVLPLIQEGKLRALAVTSEIRSPDLPDVPTMAEVSLPRLTWTAVLGPAGTPAGIANRLNAEINASLATFEMKAPLRSLGFEPKPGSPQNFAALLSDKIAT